MSANPGKKTLLERITINNILAFTIVGSYSGMWLFIMYYGITSSVSDGVNPLIQILATVEQFSAIITTMTIVVVLVVQFYFRTAPKS